jgi:tetraacyldisaccharide 4'-kinase
MSLATWLHHHLPQVWTSRGFFAWLLWPIAWVHGALLQLRRLAYAQAWRPTHRLPVPVIVVGNVVAGGAGKTPLTMALVQHLQKRGFQPGVISRGHGRHPRDTRGVMADSSPAQVGDEPLLIHQKTGAPVWVASLRADAGHALLKEHPEVNVLVCDDGLQHWALARDLEICVMDERGVGNGWLLPAGPLREPWPRAVDLLLHTGKNGLTGGFQAQRQLAPFAHDSQGRQVSLASLVGQSVDAVAGLARPEAFFAMLRAAGVPLLNTTALPDHFDYAQWPSSALTRPLLCTEKDAAKLWQHQPHALAVPLVLQAEPDFWQALNGRLTQMPFHASP